MAISAETIRDLEQAFISPKMILMDDEWIDAVVTARRSQSRLWLKIRPVEPPAALASLSILIDERDLAAVQKLLGEDRQVLPMAWEDDLCKARRQLTKVVDLDGIRERSSIYKTWRDVAEQAIHYAREGLSMIEALEADDGTPSDS